MIPNFPSLPPRNETELLARCALIEGLNVAQLAHWTRLRLPKEPAKCKGWVGLAMESALMTTAGTQALPDFHHLGIELKTIPLNEQGKPAESTFITSIPLLTIHQQQWATSTCYHKLRRVLWIPIEGAASIPFAQRRIGHAFLWSPTVPQEKVLHDDWLELTNMIALGKLEQINAKLGNYLQIRPKAATSRSLCYGFDDKGNKILTLPRGFYLRSRFTETILNNTSLV